MLGPSVVCRFCTPASSKSSLALLAETSPETNKSDVFCLNLLSAGISDLLVKFFARPQQAGTPAKCMEKLDFMMLGKGALGPRLLNVCFVYSISVYVSLFIIYFGTTHACKITRNPHLQKKIYIYIYVSVSTTPTCIEIGRKGCS